MINERKIQRRFYIIMQCFNDDERLAAHAICDFLTIETTPEEVYRDLLSCKWHKWIDQLEQVTDEVKYKMLDEWLKDKQAWLDCFGGDFWGCGDNTLIEKAGWKLLPAEQIHEEDEEGEE